MGNLVCGFNPSVPQNPAFGSGMKMKVWYLGFPFTVVSYIFTVGTCYLFKKQPAGPIASSAPDPWRGNGSHETTNGASKNSVDHFSSSA